MAISGARATILYPAVRLEASPSPSSSTRNGAPPLQTNENPAAATASKPLLSVSKPSWIVRSESNVRIEQRKKPDPPCVVCRGSGRVHCYYCHGRGRTNYADLEMLPRGEWPKWCTACGGSGLGDCSRCLGTGEYRYIMGFHFMERDAGETQDCRRRNTLRRRTVADLLPSTESGDTTHEN